MECINNLSSSKSQCDVLIVDNASTDGTSEAVKRFENASNIHYVNTGENLGGAGGYNFALKYGYQLNYKYFWLMDDDTMVQQDALGKLTETAKELDEDFGFLCNYARFTDGTASKMNIPTLAKNWLGTVPEMDNVLKVEKASFVGFFVPKKIVGKYGLPIKDFFVWADDSDYSQRISMNENCYIVMDSLVIHKMKSNADANFKAFLAEETDRMDRYFYSFRNRFFVARKKGRKTLLLYILKLMAFTLLTPWKTKRNKLRKEKIVLRGFSKGIWFNPKVEMVSDENQ